ncbi:hypothetical protein AB0E27_22775 [Streptomyces sparsogenes]|uniref:hypothetical protein n=1 Tax=Streptomyces sparsogenes TaxID=67365 RepID=UPI0033F72752
MSGATQASGITLKEPVTLDEPVPLAALQAAGMFHPPQSYRYLKADDLHQVTAAVPIADAALRKVLSDLVPA